jgi:predicted AlkP superfamily pyrophosphatase or phosphodiesterase
MNKLHTVQPDYEGGSIVNLMSSILQGLGESTNHHPPLRSLDGESLAHATNVVLLVLDGLGYQYLLDRGRDSVLCQHLIGKMTSVFPTTTATAITTFMTGLAPQQHGLTGWFTYFEELKSIVTVLPCKYRYALDEKQNISINAQQLYGHIPLFDLLNVGSFIVTPEMIAYSEFSLSHRGKAQIKPYVTLAECFDYTTDIIQSSARRKYIYTYWPQFDGMAHERGVQSQDVANHFADIDKAFEKFINDIKGTNTLVIATADHGIIDSGAEHCIEVENYPELLDMLSLPLSGERRMAYCYVNPDRREDFQSFVSNHFSGQIDMLDSQQLIAQNYYGLGVPHPRLNRRVGDYALFMRGNMTIMDTLETEKRFYHVGTHGGLSEEEMLVPLIVVSA